MWQRWRFTLLINLIMCVQQTSERCFMIFSSRAGFSRENESIWKCGSRKYRQRTILRRSRIFPIFFLIFPRRVYRSSHRAVGYIKFAHGGSAMVSRLKITRSLYVRESEITTISEIQEQIQQQQPLERSSATLSEWRVWRKFLRLLDKSSFARIQTALISKILITRSLYHILRH